MTFYHVLSALLFFGALRVVIVSIETGSIPRLFTSVCVSALVLNDMLATSLHVEKNRREYTLPLMLLDLFNFLLLSLALIVISPNLNHFEVEAPRLAGSLGAPAFWFLLAIYWVALILWTRQSLKGLEQQSRRVVLWQWSVAVVFAVVGLAQLVRVPYSVSVGGAIASVFAVLYLTLIRTLVTRNPAAAQRRAA